ncbi:MAG: carbohydrate ABC transporter permease [Acuticoccus sp.]
MTRLAGVLKHLALLAAAAVVLVPFLWIAAAAFKTQISLLMGHVRFSPTMMNFDEVLFSKTSEYLHNFANSMIVGIASTLLVLAVALPAAFSLARMRWPRWSVHALLGWSAFFHMIPPIMLAGPWYVMAQSVGLENTYAALILAHVTLNLPMGLWLMTIFVRDVPVELVEAARIDGAETPQILTKVILPLVSPGLAATGVLVFVFSWNEFPIALTLSQKDTATVPVAIAKYAQEYEIAYTQMAAAALLSTIPAVILLVLAQRFIVRGLTSGAVK